MPVIAIVGAGPQLGLALARTFGTKGYKVALVSRHPARQHSLIGALATEGIEAAAFRADVYDRASISSGLADVKHRFGPVDVLEFSPFRSWSRACVRLAVDSSEPSDRIRLQRARRLCSCPGSIARHAGSPQRHNPPHHMAGETSAFIYRASILANRPAADYTPRLVPQHPGAFVPLEAPFILWHEAPSWR
jgi:hypothetical protein